MNLSPYFPASKNCMDFGKCRGSKEKADAGQLCHGTVDSWLIYKLTNGKSYKTDYSNASRTQLFNIFDLKWDEEICEMFGIDAKNMAEVCDSNSNFGEKQILKVFFRILFLFTECWEILTARCVRSRLSESRND